MTTPTRDHPPRSPCVKACTLDAQNVCVGCLRTIDEIARWDSMSREEQMAVLGRLARRAADRSST